MPSPLQYNGDSIGTWRNFGDRTKLASLLVIKMATWRSRWRPFLLAEHLTFLLPASLGSKPSLLSPIRGGSIRLSRGSGPLGALLFLPPVGGNRFLGSQKVVVGAATPQPTNTQLPNARTRRTEAIYEATTSVRNNTLRSSYLVTNCIAKAKKPLTIGEELILFATKDICRELLGEAVVEKIAHAPLSTDTVTRRIEEIAEDIEAQLFEKISASTWYALQVDESTDIDNKGILLAYVRYPYQEDVHEDLLCALPLPTNKSLDGYISRQLKWSICVGICTDGDATMTRRLSDLTARMMEVAPESESTHCLIHREVLASRKMSPEFNSVLTDVIKVINYIKERALNSRLFEQLCEEMGIEYRCLLLHTEVRWTATTGSDVVQSGRPIFDDFFQHLWPYIGNNTANVVFQMVKRLWLIHIDQ
ncbi:SCAN domain-containing protein 3 [Trichonephila clavipes]|nr:SCAN domain-containing protein 3 [Trichonephila clavipes]